MKKLFLFFTLIFTAFAANSGLFDKKQTFLKVDDAFAFSATLSTDKSQLQAIGILLMAIIYIKIRLMLN